MIGTRTERNWKLDPSVKLLVRRSLSILAVERLLSLRTTNRTGVQLLPALELFLGAANRSNLASFNGGAGG
jgi:hypothetical protein